MRITTLSICLILIGHCPAQDAKARAAWAWSTAKTQPPQKSPGCTCKPCTCIDGCKCALPLANASQSEPDAPVELILEVPNTARVWIEGQEMTSMGVSRRFNSPPLPAGKDFVYTIRVQDAYGTEETIQVPVRAGHTKTLNFREAAVRADRLPPMPGMPLGNVVAPFARPMSFWAGSCGPTG